jgi:hypothetical protein
LVFFLGLRLGRGDRRPLPSEDAAAATTLRSLALLADQSQHACRDARGMPIHSHHGAKRLEPERMREPPQIFVFALFVHRHFAAQNETGTRIMPAICPLRSR